MHKSQHADPESQDTLLQEENDGGEFDSSIMVLISVSYSLCYTHQGGARGVSSTLLYLPEVRVSENRV